MDLPARVDPHARPPTDPSQLEHFVTANYPSVWRLCAGLVGESSADDLAQESFTRAIAAMPRFRGQATPRTWMLAIAHRACMDELRGRYRRSRRNDRLVEAARPAGTAAEPGDGLTTRDLLARLQPDRRAAFVLTQLLGLSYSEAASVCDCPTGTIRSRIARAREDLIELLGHVPAAEPATPHSRPAGS
jgi:RNA polymerase sigma-70 factor (ECF subfamily)